MDINHVKFQTPFQTLQVFQQYYCQENSASESFLKNFHYKIRKQNRHQQVSY